jgi:hypothetical protein
MSNSVNLSKLLNTSTTINTEKLSTDVPLGTEDYSTANDLPATGNQVGDQAFVQATNRLYIWTGAGWYNIALINQTPTWDSTPDAYYDLDSIGGGSTTIALAATDPDGLPIQWSYLVTDSGNDLATITNESNGTFTITAKSFADIVAAGYDSQGGSFDITFKASDGVNIATAVSEFSLSFMAPCFGTNSQGCNYGYVGGRYPSVNQTEKFALTSDTNATEVGSDGGTRIYTTGHQSAESAYFTGGYRLAYPTVYTYTDIRKHAFANDGNATFVGNLTQRLYAHAGNSSDTYGYAAGGTSYLGSLPASFPAEDSFMKFPFASDNNATNVGVLTHRGQGVTGISSTDNGYNVGGYYPGPNVRYNIIDKFPFASDVSIASDVGDMPTVISGAIGNSSDTHGYASGGQSGPSPTDRPTTINKFPFASNGNASTVANLFAASSSVAGNGVSSVTHGYALRSATELQRFAYASDTDAVSLTAIFNNAKDNQGTAQY